MDIRGKLEDHTWLRRPELRPLEMKEHKTHKGLFFELGEDSTGKVDVRRVIYPSDWPIERVKQAIQNREQVMTTEGCSHCQVMNKAREQITERKQQAMGQSRMRLFPGKRPFRDFLLAHGNRA